MIGEERRRKAGRRQSGYEGAVLTRRKDLETHCCLCKSLRPRDNEMLLDRLQDIPTIPLRTTRQAVFLAVDDERKGGGVNRPSSMAGSADSPIRKSGLLNIISLENLPKSDLAFTGGQIVVLFQERRGEERQPAFPGHLG